MLILFSLIAITSILSVPSFYLFYRFKLNLMLHIRSSEISSWSFKSDLWVSGLRKSKNMNEMNAIWKSLGLCDCLFLKLYVSFKLSLKLSQVRMGNCGNHLSFTIMLINACFSRLMKKDYMGTVFNKHFALVMALSGSNIYQMCSMCQT